MVLPSWVTRGGLPGPGRTGHHQPAPAVMGVLFIWTSRRPALMTWRMAGVWTTSSREWWSMPLIVVAGALAGLQARPDPLGQQVRDRGHLGDELPPARQGGQLQMLASPADRRRGRAARVTTACPPRRTGRRSASGSTAATVSWPGCRRPGRFAAGPPLAAGPAWMRAGWAALVRAATRRSRLLSPARRLRRRALAGPVEQVRDRVGEFGLGRAGHGLAGVVPGQLAERGGDPVQLVPEHGDPAAVPVVADPDPGDVVGVVVDLPQVLAVR